MSRSVIKINTAWTKEISLTVILMFLIQSMFSNELRVIVYGVLLVALLLFHKRVVVPTIYGAGIYLVSIFIMMIYGLFVNNIPDFSKGTFYVINNIVIVIVAYYACRFGQNKSLLKTLYLICALQMISTWFKLLINITAINSMQSLRSAMGDRILESLMFSVLLFYECILNKKIIYGRKKDIFLMSVIMIAAVMSLGRTQILCMIVGVFVAYIISIIKAERKQRIIRNLIISTIVGGGLVVLTFILLPDNFTTPFVNKVENTFTELSTDNEFKDEASISGNWRGYEIKNAKEQWEEANIAEEIVGQGIGTTIRLKNLPATQIEVYGLVDSTTPLLHNGYYTLLIKGGILAVLGVLLWFLYPVRVFSSQVKSKYLISIYAEMLIMNVMMLIIMYVIRGLVGSSSFMVWSVVIGWNSCKLKQVR